MGGLSVICLRQYLIANIQPAKKPITKQKGITMAKYHILKMAGVAGLEPAAYSFGDYRSANWTTLLE